MCECVCVVPLDQVIDCCMVVYFGSDGEHLSTLYRACAHCNVVVIVYH